MTKEPGLEPGLNRWQAAARRAASRYRANRADLEPLVRLVADVLAVAAPIRSAREDHDEGANGECLLG